MKRLLLLLIAVLGLTSCNSQKIFEEYDISYSRSGGLAPIYENMLIKGQTVHYFYEGHGKKYNKKSTLSQKEKTALYQAIESNKLSTIREDYKKVYDHITTTVKVRTPREDIYKNDGSFIMPQDQKRWENIVGAFEALVEEKNLRTP